MKTRKKSTASIVPADGSIDQAHDPKTAATAKTHLGEAMQAVATTASLVTDAGALPKTLDGLEQLRILTTGSLDHTVDESARAKLNDVLDAISDAKAELNRADIQNHTISLQAAEDELKPGITALTQLKAELAAIADVVADSAKVIAGIDSTLGLIDSLLKTFP